MSPIRALLVLLFCVITASAMAKQQRHYDFKVYLDDTEIGHHRFVITPRDALTYVTSEASFDVKFLFLSVYQYLHSNSEVWHKDCLQAINATTNDNGDALYVRGQKRQSQLLLETHTGEQQLAGCVRTFAYWDKQLLAGQQLLNSQTGEMEPVSIESLGEEIIKVRNVPVRANHIRIRNDKFNIDLWYANDQEWVALESTTENGAQLRYRIQ